MLTMDISQRYIFTDHHTLYKNRLTCYITTHFTDMCIRHFFLASERRSTVDVRHRPGYKIWRLFKFSSILLSFKTRHWLFILIYTRSYYRKENAASPPRAGTMRNLLNKGQFMRSRFARTRSVWGGMISMYWNESQCTIHQKTLFSRDRL